MALAASMEADLNLQASEPQAWVGRSETVRDTIGPTPVAALAATLDHLQPLPAFDGIHASYPQWLAMLANAPAP